MLKTFQKKNFTQKLTLCSLIKLFLVLSDNTEKSDTEKSEEEDIQSTPGSIPHSTTSGNTSSSNSSSSSETDSESEEIKDESDDLKDIQQVRTKSNNSV